MKKYILLAMGAALGIGANVYVDYLQAQPVSQPQTEIILKVTPSDIDILSDGLQTQPFGKVMPLINKLRQQVMEQQKPVTPPAVSSPMPTEQK